MVESLFAMAKLSVEVMVLLFGTLTLWLGFLRIAEKAGIVDALARWLAPLFARLMPGSAPWPPGPGPDDVELCGQRPGPGQRGHAHGPQGHACAARAEPQQPDTATNAQILFLVLNASSLTLLPVSIFMYRMQQGAADPTLVFLPILLATSASTLVGLLAWPLCSAAAVAPGGAGLPAAGGAGAGRVHGAAHYAERRRWRSLSSLLGNLTLFGLVVLFVLVGAWRKVPVYEAFVEGAREGFDVAKGLLPYLVAMLCAVGVLRTSGALGYALDGIRWWWKPGMDTRFVDALPTALVKPFSGSAARAMLIETMQTPGRGQLCGAGQPPPSRAARKPRSTCWRCTLARWAYSVRATRWAAPCWPNWRGCWPRLGCATSSLGSTLMADEFKRWTASILSWQFVS
jgi:spore maturation protein SpmA